MLHKIQLFFIMLFLCISRICGSVYTLSWSNETSVDAARYQLKMVPATRSLYENIPLASGGSLARDMFNGFIESNQRKTIFSIDTALYPYGTYFFEWILFLVVEGKDIPVGRALFGINTDGTALSIGVISQSSIKNDLHKVRFFDGMAADSSRDTLLAKNRIALYYNSMNYRHEDIGKLSLSSGISYSYRLMLGLRAEALDAKNPLADRRIWGSFTIINKE